MIQKILNRILYSLHKSVLNLLAGKKAFQGFFRYFYSIGLEGMNYGNGEMQSNGELEVIKYIKKIISNEKEIIIFDVGANAGDYSLNLIKIFKNSNFTLHAFEPSKKTFANLTSNLFGNNIQLHNIGIGNETGQMTLYLSHKDTAGTISSLYNRNLTHRNIEMNDRETIEIATIDEFCEKNKIKKIDFLKLDIEGHEIKALEGATKMMKSDKIRFIQFEFGGTDIDARIFFKDFYTLLKEKYNLYRIVKDGIYPIANYSEDLEIFVYINYLAEHK
ncbi:MAG: FkbM family methyltransferase [Bacteroidetes bacterium]|nr:FkbM family methyltransferase [Bacteroidota bacterium]